MESTGFYWKSLFLLLQSYDFEVLLVNAHHIKTIGKKTDVKDARWIWRLHTAGLLQGSYQPDEFTGQLRTYNRQRQSLIREASRHSNKMKKSLVLMNLHLSVVLSDIMSKSGQRIIQSILNGERNGQKLANLADRRVKKSKAEIAKALTGTWHEEHLFTLKQSWDAYQFYQAQIQSCDEMIEQLLQQKVEVTGQNDLDFQPKKGKKKRPTKNSVNVDIPRYAYQLTDGIDLTEIEGVSINTIMTLIAEVGLDLKDKFPTAKHFASWLGLSPNHKITGGKVISNKTKKNKQPLATALRQAANAIGNRKGGALNNFFKRIAFRKGRIKAITATARKLAVIIYNMLVHKQPYKPALLEEQQIWIRQAKIKHIQKIADEFQIELKEVI